MQKKQGVWAMPNFKFEVLIDGIPSMYFTKVEGLDPEERRMEYRHGRPKRYSEVFELGKDYSGSVELIDGSLAKDKASWYFLAQINMGIAEPKEVSIRLCDERGYAILNWYLSDALPQKMNGAKANRKEISIDSITFQYKSLTNSSIPNFE